MKIALYIRDRNKDVEALLKRLREKGATLACFGDDFSSWEDLPGDTELFLSLGGDGTFLQSLTFVRDRGIPVAGINFGRLGFLTTARADDVDTWIDDLLGGRFTVEERSLLRVTCTGLPDDFYPYALNEVSLQRQGASMLAVQVRVEGRELPTYWADGLVVATPTGSTAYNLSVGGPVVLPSSAVNVIAPIAPHNLNVRPLVLPETAKVDIRIECRDGVAIMSTDNRSVEIEPDWTIHIEMAQFSLKRIRLAESGFVKALTSRLFWGEDIRNNN